MKDWEEFFKDYGDYNIKLIFYENSDYIRVEDLYRMFKARLLDELKQTE